MKYAVKTTAPPEDEEQEPLYCGCRTQEEHDEGVRLQEQMRGTGRNRIQGCVGCWVGDDGPSVHDCYIHRA